MQKAIIGLTFAVLFAELSGFAVASSPPAPVAHPVPPSAVAPPADTRARYIVVFKGAPVPLHYSLGRRPANAQKAHRTESISARAKGYSQHLETRHAEFLRRAATALHRNLRPHFTYRYALNGMSLSLDHAEAARVADLPTVRSVTPVRYFRPSGRFIPASAADTGVSRAWIGAPDLWPLPRFKGLDAEGEGVVVADIDTGINSANQSFAAVGPVDGYSAENPLGSGQYLGVCDPSNSDQAAKKPPFFHCNDKLIGAYSYTNAGDDPHSPEDSQGHGSHTASTAAGNLVEVDLNGSKIPLSGVAPHAELIVYDICDPTHHCASDKAVKAIDQAIEDYQKLSKTARFKGMAINFSVGGGDYAYTDPVAQAFLAAAAAGIDVSASAGNGGPINENEDDKSLLYPVEHTAPWVTTVAATTHDGVFSNMLTVTGGSDAPAPIVGSGMTGALENAPIVYAGDYSYGANYDYADHLDADGTYAPREPPKTTADIAAAARECKFPFPPDTFPAGAIVVCDRGDIARVQKASNIAWDWSKNPDDNYSSGTSGGAGFVLANSDALDELYEDAYAVPGVQIHHQDAVALEDWLKNNPGPGGATSPTNPPNPALSATIAGTTQSHDSSQADFVAGFSSRGPTDTKYDNVIKPDVAAPGVNVLAALANPAYADGSKGAPNEPETYGLADGTSMAAPHVTGAAALLEQLHPDWTPAEIKSALMLTAAVDSLGDACASRDSNQDCIAARAVPSPHVRGAGRIDASLANRTGIVMNASRADYKAANPVSDGDLTALNLASLANNDCILKCHWTRTLTSALESTTASYSIAVSRQTSGLSVSADPDSFTLAPGESQEVTFTADAGGLPVKHWAYAQIDLTSHATGDDGKPVPAMHLPLAIEPQPPQPRMLVTPSSLNLDVQNGATASARLNIADNGLGKLDWRLLTRGRSSRIKVFTRPYKGSTNGLPSARYTRAGHGVYSAAHFDMPVDGTIGKILADGFAQTDDGQPVDLSSDAKAIDFYIYADGPDGPAGNPEDGRGDYLWHAQVSPKAAGINVAAGRYRGGIQLDLKAAGQKRIKLEAGKYWLIVAVAFDASYGDSDAPSWYWLQSKKTTSGALLLDPGDLLDQDGTVYSTGASVAFTLTGTFHCDSGTLGFNRHQGTVKSGTDADVKVTFDASQANSGIDNWSVCVTGNDPDDPVTAVPVTVEVTGLAKNGASDSDGGGGSTGWAFVPLALACLGIRRRRWTTRNGCSGNYYY
jgi:subtilisin family serine protease